MPRPVTSLRTGFAGLRVGSWMRGAALLACWSLLFQSFVPLLHTPPTEGAAGIPAWELATICHVDLAPANLERDGKNHDPSPAPGDHAPICPICLGLHIAGTFVAPPPVALPTPIRQASAAFFENVRRAARPAHRRLIQARAPPALA